MKRKVLVVGIIVLLIVVGLSGCIQQNENGNEEDGSELDDDTGDTTGKTVIMNATEFHEDVHDRSSSSHDSSGTVSSSYTREYDSVDDGDILIVHDNITKTYYDMDKDKTRITLSDPVIIFSFKGDITELYQVGDEIKITVTIKHVNFTYNDKYHYDVEIYEEAWVNEEHFFQHRFGAPLPPSCIEKVII